MWLRKIQLANLNRWRQRTGWEHTNMLSAANWMEETISKKQFWTQKKKSLRSYTFIAQCIMQESSCLHSIRIFSLKKKNCQTVECIQFLNVPDLPNCHHHLLFIEHPQCSIRQYFGGKTQSLIQLFMSVYTDNREAAVRINAVEAGRKQGCCIWARLGRVIFSYFLVYCFVVVVLVFSWSHFTFRE